MENIEQNHDKVPLERACYTIHSYHTDLKKQASLPALFLFMQESAWHHAAVNNFGWEALIEKNLIWALARMRVKIYRYPSWTDTVQLETWSKPPEPLMAYRDFEIFDSKGESMLVATSAWLLVDATSRRPQRISVLGDCFPLVEGREAIGGTLHKMTERPSAQYSPVFTVPFSAIDVNGHVNNAHYVQWVLDAFPKDYILENNVSEIEINFMQESRLGDHLQVNIEEIAPDKYISNIVRIDDNKELIRMSLEFGVR